MGKSRARQEVENESQCENQLTDPLGYVACGRIAFLKENLYMRIQDERGEICQDDSFAELLPCPDQRAESLDV